MGCASAKHVSTVQNEEDTQNGKNYQNGDAFCDEYRFKPVEEVKYMKNGEEEEQKIVTRNQENLNSRWEDSHVFTMCGKYNSSALQNREKHLHVFFGYFNSNICFILTLSSILNLT
uniref:Uncharacterized protein n=1 Tax=Pyxicephalus adspersus TaxID=30357 RepID=A0AAV2ZWM6_PYXAD|nr:TPA: hypothetical protein GDO54_016488 [Pyxicephalus adspersus]